MGQLVTLAEIALREKLGALKRSEIKLLRCVAAGEPADYREHNKEKDDPDKKKDDPSNASEWGENRTLRAEIINWLCTNKKASYYFTNSGVQIAGAKIIGRIDLSGAAMDYLFIVSHCYILQGIDISYARVNFLALDGSHIGHDGDPEAVAFLGDSLIVRGSVFFRDGAKFVGATRLLGAEIGGQLNCRGSSFINLASDAFNADQIIVKGSVFFSDGARFEGVTRLSGAKIGGQLTCSRSSFINPLDVAFGGDGMTVKGSVRFDGKALFEGETRLLDAKIGGELNCQTSSFINFTCLAFNGDRMTINGSVFLSDSAKFKGMISLCSAQIGSQLALDKGVFLNNGDKALNLQSVIVKNQLLLNKISDIKGDIVLTDGSVSTLKDDAEYWKNNNRIFLKGFTYKRIECDDDHKELLTAEARLQWLAFQEGFHPQTYDQLARAFRNMGQEREAQDVLIAKNRRKRKDMNRVLQIWDFLFDISTRYGYSMNRLFWTSIVFFIAGIFIFCIANDQGIMHFPSSTLHQADLEFNSVLYSLDTLLPIVDLNQEKYWVPVYQAESAWSQITYVYLPIQILMGWFLTTMLLAAITGLIRQE